MILSVGSDLATRPLLLAHCRRVGDMLSSAVCALCKLGRKAKKEIFVCAAKVPRALLVLFFW